MTLSSTRLESGPLQRHHPDMSHPCTEPHHHVHDAPSFVAAVERACRERGLRLTPIRARVLGLIARQGKPIKAYDLLDQLRADNERADKSIDEESAGAAAPPTVYRALDFLLANGFIHKLESVNAFVACHHPNTAQHSVPFLICDRCHSAVELEDRDVVSALDERARALGFVPQAQTLEVHGICARCAQSG
jgi:Fur family transcriptional regulator, zinc uptake regulator